MFKICSKCGYYKEHGVRNDRARPRPACYCKTCSVDTVRMSAIGVSREQVDRAFLQQEGYCAICQNDLNVGKWDADHCHDTGAFRGLLCTGCNRGIGLLKDSPEIVARALEYLR